MFDVGLQTNILPLEGHDIGQFLGLESMEKVEAQAYQPATWFIKQNIKNF